MSSNENYEETIELLKKHNQEHLLAFWDELDSEKRERLLSQIGELNFSKIDDWIACFVENTHSSYAKEDFEPVDYYKPEPENASQKEKYARASSLGRKLISEGKVAAFVVAGGQGTRLGFDGPKGNFPISPVKNKTLFQIFAETISAASQKYGAVCPWYIMTSPLNYGETVEIFRSNDYYGLGKENVYIFQQGTLPNFSKEGKILLADKANIARSPDGHGGSFGALHKTGALDDMKKRGVEFISYWQVDNPLINIFDPLFLGLHALDEAQMSSKALRKADPKEKIGNFCKIRGRVHVIEYSDLSDELAFMRNPEGSLVFELGSIAIHIISRSFIEDFIARDKSLPLHRAVKSIPHIDESGKQVESEGIKLETFIFDALPLASKSIVFETIRSEEFAPTKNATGVDSAESSRQMMIDRAADWLESAGVKIPRKADGSPDCIIEIAPSFAIEKEDVRAKLDQVPPIKPNDRIYLE